ncbi:MAG: Dabb family protein [Bacteroidales bacterium]
MIKHIVIFKFKDQAEGNDAKNNIALFREMLLQLPAKIECIKTLEIGQKQEKSPETNADLVLTVEFEDWNGLETYTHHPAHVEVVIFAKKVIESRMAVDYETI